LQEQDDQNSKETNELAATTEQKGQTKFDAQCCCEAASWVPKKEPAQAINGRRIIHVCKAKNLIKERT
jgi:hypothetical protein